MVVYSHHDRALARPVVSPLDYRPRIVDAELDELMHGVAAVVLEGPKAVGKTVTGTRRAATVHRLDDPPQLAVAIADPSLLVRGARPVLIDEWQRLPESWDVVRRAVDDDPTPGQYLLAGSAIPSDAPAHSGAGRIVTVRMRPLSLAERGVETSTVSLQDLLSGRRPALDGTTAVGLTEYVREIVASGFPGFRGMSGRQLRAQLDGYLDRIVTRDFPEMGRSIRNPAVLRRWLSAYAAATSTTASYETIRNAATAGYGEKPAKSTTRPYADILERLWIVEPVPAWLPSRSRIARLSAPPKHQLADPALAARLLRLDVDALLTAQPGSLPSMDDEPLLGNLFESFVTQSLRVYAQAAEADVMHLRTKGGEREVDLIVQGPDGAVVAIQVKLARTIRDRDVGRLTWLREVAGPVVVDEIVVTTGPHAFRRPDGIGVIPFALLGP
jgi:predicted AAA+ superfamily ATPase